MTIKKTQVKNLNTTTKLSSLKISPYKITPSKKQINSLIQKIQNKKVDAKGKSSIRLEFSQDDYNFLIELLKLSTKIGQLEKLIDVLDDEAEFHLNMILRAKKSIRSKGARLKDYQEALKILNAKLPKRGKRPTYNMKEVKEILKLHKFCKDKLRNINSPLSPEQKRSAVKTVNKEYFPMSDPDSTRLFLLHKYKESGVSTKDMELPGRVK